MTYRVIEVNGNDYRFVIGGKFTKILPNKPSFPGIVVENQKIGNPIYNGYAFDKEDGKPTGYVVSPHHIRKLILGIPHGDIPKVHKCSHGTETIKLTANPFDGEIYQRTTYMIACRQCWNNVTDDI